MSDWLDLSPAERVRLNHRRPVVKRAIEAGYFAIWERRARARRQKDDVLRSDAEDWWVPGQDAVLEPDREHSVPPPGEVAARKPGTGDLAPQAVEDADLQPATEEVASIAGENPVFEPAAEKMIPTTGSDAVTEPGREDLPRREEPVTAGAADDLSSRHGESPISRAEPGKLAPISEEGSVAEPDIEELASILAALIGTAKRPPQIGRAAGLPWDTVAKGLRVLHDRNLIRDVAGHHVIRQRSCAGPCAREGRDLSGNPIYFQPDSLRWFCEECRKPKP